MIAGALLLGVLGLTLLHTLFDLPHAQLLAQLALVAFVLVAWRQLRRLAQCFAVLGGVSLVLVGWPTSSSRRRIWCESVDCVTCN